MLFLFRLGPDWIHVTLHMVWETMKKKGKLQDNILFIFYWQQFYFPTKTFFEDWVSGTSKGRDGSKWKRKDLLLRSAFFYFYLFLFLLILLIYFELKRILNLSARIHIVCSELLYKVNWFVLFLYGVFYLNVFVLLGTLIQNDLTYVSLVNNKIISPTLEFHWIGINCIHFFMLEIIVSYYLFYILHSDDFFRKVSSFSKINSVLHYYEFSYIDLKYVNLSVVYIFIQGTFFCCSVGLLIVNVAITKF